MLAPPAFTRVLKNPAFTLRQAQGERVGCWNCWRFSVRDELVEARSSLFQHPVTARRRAERTSLELFCGGELSSLRAV